VVDGIGEMLGFEAEPARSAGKELHGGLGGADFHDPAL